MTGLASQVVAAVASPEAGCDVAGLSAGAWSMSGRAMTRARQRLAAKWLGLAASQLRQSLE